MARIPEPQDEPAVLPSNDPRKLATARVDFSFRRTDRFAGIPSSFTCHSLNVSSSTIVELPSGWRATYKIDLSNCLCLERLPRGLKTSVLVLRGCWGLCELPDDMEVDYLDISNCASLRNWPSTARVRIGAVIAQGCVNLSKLPSGLGPLSSLDVRGCRKLMELPADLVVRSWIDIAGTNVMSLPATLARTPLRWRGVPINAQIAFFPETITAAQILSERNAEVRRVMIERVGYERFLKEANAEVLHRDRDPGGERQLVRVRLENDEPLVCVSVRCPSTGRQYLIRVPPNGTTCHAAVAWSAGFDNPADYNPALET